MSILILVCTSERCISLSAITVIFPNVETNSPKLAPSTSCLFCFFSYVYSASSSSSSSFPSIIIFFLSPFLPSYFFHHPQFLYYTFNFLIHFLYHLPYHRIEHPFPSPPHFSPRSFTRLYSSQPSIILTSQSPTSRNHGALVYLFL